MRAWLQAHPWHQSLPLPALLVQALVLLGSHRIWTETLTATVWHGGTRPVVVAYVYLAGAVLTAGGYQATYILGTPGAGPSPYGRGRAGASESRVGYALALLRILCVVTLYALTTRIVVQYALR